MASLHSDRSDFEQAEALFLRALQAEPDSAEVYNNFGFFHERRGNLLAALEHYEKAQRLMLPQAHPQIDVNVRNAQDRIRSAEQQQSQPLQDQIVQHEVQPADDYGFPTNDLFEPPPPLQDKEPREPDAPALTWRTAS